MRGTPFTPEIIATVKRIARPGCRLTFSGDLSFEGAIRTLGGRELEAPLRGRSEHVDRDRLADELTMPLGRPRSHHRARSAEVFILRLASVPNASAAPAVARRTPVSSYYAESLSVVSKANLTEKLGPQWGRLQGS